MGSERVSNLAVINIERHFTNRVDISSVIDIFEKRHNRDQYFFSQDCDKWFIYALLFYSVNCQ